MIGGPRIATATIKNLFRTFRSSAFTSLHPIVLLQILALRFKFGNFDHSGRDALRFKGVAHPRADLGAYNQMVLLANTKYSNLFAA